MRKFSHFIKILLVAFPIYYIAMPATSRAIWHLLYAFSIHPSIHEWHFWFYCLVTGLVTMQLMQFLFNSCLVALHLVAPKDRNSLGAKIIGFLKPLPWLFGRETREHLELMMSDLHRDQIAMLEKKLSPWYVALCVALGLMRGILPILWDVFMRLLEQLAGAAKLIWQIIGKG